MPLRPPDLFSKLSAEQSFCKRVIESVERSGRQRANRIAQLTEQRTKAFVDLARHYLPELSHRTLADAWVEVQSEIRDILLQKDDRRRTIQSQIATVIDQRHELEDQREIIREQLNKSRIKLACKTGNFKKAVREDPETSRISNEVEQIDQDIERVLQQFELAQQAAKSKLPAYEQCELFQYLNDRKFGTPEYTDTGITRRWDRWVAKLIGYRKAKTSYDHLTETPDILQELIRKKQNRYRKLLRELESARRRAHERFDVGDQKQEWQNLSSRVGDLDDKIEELRWTEAKLEDDLCVLENPNGKFYDAALAIYQSFLTQLEPNILDVYAQCTDSPVDDQICARLRNIQQRIAAERDTAVKRKHSVAEMHRYETALAEIRVRLRDYIRWLPADVEFSDDLCFDEWLRRVKQQTVTPGDVWRAVKLAMIPVNPDTGIASEPTFMQKQIIADSIGPTDAAYRASDWSVEHSQSNTHPDPTGVIYVPPKSDVGLAQNAVASSVKFTPIAICPSSKEASEISKLLDENDVMNFVCDAPSVIPGLDADVETLEDVNVMVPLRLANHAYEILSNHRENDEAPWTCPRCRQANQRGYGLCQRCGEHRPRASRR